jgi:hypothetical protein
MTTVFGEPAFAGRIERSGTRGVVARASREIEGRRGVSAWLLSLDDSTLATFGYDRRAIAEVGRRPLAL